MTPRFSLMWPTALGITSNKPERDWDTNAAALASASSRSSRLARRSFVGIHSATNTAAVVAVAEIAVQSGR